mmetsp:Transcript_51811/g.90393  ORF Transcript_51811/g.90393 Transcript_51811/m.90393 type:complete len:210 (-) Transcript_51811:388-1017(-)
MPEAHHTHLNGLPRRSIRWSARIVERRMHSCTTLRHGVIRVVIFKHHHFVSGHVGIDVPAVSGVGTNQRVDKRHRKAVILEESVVFSLGRMAAQYDVIITDGSGVQDCQGVACEGFAAQRSPEVDNRQTASAQLFFGNTQSTFLDIIRDHRSHAMLEHFQKLVLHAVGEVVVHGEGGITSKSSSFRQSGSLWSALATQSMCRNCGDIRS